MVRHIVSWNYKESLSSDEKVKAAEKIKNDLEALTDILEGIISIEVITNPLSTGTVDVVLNCLFDNEETLAKYQVHDRHKQAGAFISKVMCNRTCIDYME